VRHAPLLECPRVAVMAESSRIGQNATLSVQRQVFFARAKQRIQKHVAVHRVLKRGLNEISAIGLFIAYMGCTTLSQSLETPSHCNQFTLKRILRSRHQNQSTKTLSKTIAIQRLPAPHCNQGFRTSAFLRDIVFRIKQTIKLI
jgi:hypothetical protein